MRLRGEIEQLFGRERNPAHTTSETLLEPKDSTVERIEGAGHGLFTDQPEAFAESVKRFLSET